MKRSGQTWQIEHHRVMVRTTVDAQFRVGVCETSAAVHTGLAVNTPRRPFKTGYLRRLSPRQHLLIHAVHQDSIKIKHDGKTSALKRASPMINALTWPP